MKTTQKNKNKRIRENEFVTSYKYGHTIELSNVLGGNPIMKKIDKDRMVNTITGEIVEVEHAKNRADPKNKESLRQTFKRLRRLIGTNFTGGNNELWVTLTYSFDDYFNSGKKEPMNDGKKLFEDFKYFIKKLRNYFGKYLGYIAVAEPQGNSAWHLHILLKTLDKTTLYIPNKVLADLWGHGFVNVKRLKESDKVASYLMAYLSNIDLNNLNGNFENDENKPKRIVKGGRLSLYPMHFRIYRTSRLGIKKPTKIKATANEVKNIYGISEHTEPEFFKTSEIKRNDKSFEVTTEYYNFDEKI